MEWLQKFVQNIALKITKVRNHGRCLAGEPEFISDSTLKIRTPFEKWKCSRKLGYHSINLHAFLGILPVFDFCLCCGIKALRELYLTEIGLFPNSEHSNFP